MMAVLYRLPNHMPRAAALAAALAVPLGALAADGHAGHGHHPAPQAGPMEHGAHGGHDHAGHAGMQHSPAGAALPPNIPRLTDADRAAAFPPLSGHAPHGRSLNSLLLFEKLEYQDADDGSALVWDASGWIGGDIDRLWLRSEGERTNGHTEQAELQALWGHAIGPWWELVGGLRQDFKPGSAQTWAAIGLQGMPFYGLETEITAYYGEGGQSALRLEADYDLLLTNRLILQPTVETNFYGRNDRERGAGAGLGEIEAGLRLRYEISRQFAPYIGVSWGRLYGNSEDLARDEGEDEEEARLVAGIRLWF